MLIDASAGTGKTYTISSLVVRLLVEEEMAINEILVVTYTEAAVEDLKRRVREKVVAAVEAFSSGESDDAFLQEMVDASDRPQRRAQLLNLALRNFDEASIFTIHGFCRRVLSEYSLESGVPFASELITDQHDLLKEITEDFFRVNFYESSPLVAAWFYKKFSPPELMKKLGTVYNRDDVLIIPQVDGGVCRRELGSAEAEYSEKFRELAGRWSAEREDVARILQDSKALNRNRYRVKSVPVWLLAMERLASTRETTPELFDAFGKFTSTQLALATKAGCELPASGFFDFCETLNQARVDLDNALNDFGKYLEAELFSFTKNELEKRKAAANVHSFDDLLSDLHRALGSEGGVALARSLALKYKAALIDEFQDTDPVQYEIFARIFSGRDSLLYLIGDPKQAIYSFRGADIFAYIRAVREVAGNRYTLGENWRSVSGLVGAVNTLFGNRHTPFVFDEILFEPAKVAGGRPDFIESLEIDGKVPPPFCLQLHRRNGVDDEKGKLISKDAARQEVLSWLTSEVSALLRKGETGAAVIGGHPLCSGDVAILVRTNMEARMVQEALGRAGISSAIHSSESLFASKDAIEVRIFLEAVMDAGNGRKARAAMATKLLGVSAQDLDLGCDSDELFSIWHEKFRKYQRDWSRRGFAGMFADFLEEEEVRARLLSLQGGERSLTNVQHLLEALHLAAVEKKLGMTGLVKYLSAKIAAGDDRPADELQLRLDSDADLVQIVTIHKSKGLEYPVVFCPFCWEGSRLAGARQKARSFLFHDPCEVGKLILDIGSTEAENNLLYALREEMAENMRLLYVALTRASHRCYLSWGPFSGAGTSALAYLLHGRDQTTENDSRPLWAADYLEGLNDEEISADLGLLAEQGEGNIEIKHYASVPLLSIVPLRTKVEAGICREFAGLTGEPWRMSSFSSMTRSVHQRDYFPAVSGSGEESSAKESFTDIMDFPHGAGPGVFLHELLEDLDFTMSDPEVVSALLRPRLFAAGYDLSWAEVLTSMLLTLLKTPLSPDNPDLILAKAGKEARLNELEFYFPMEDFCASEVNDLLNEWSLPGLPEERLNGFIKGFIDLVFSVGNKFYIVDWKSNLLGRNPEAYLPGNLKQVMEKEYYVLQYLIYTVALHRYLKLRIPGYRYEDNFGGAYYIFLRGVGGPAGSGSGVFSDIPPVKLVEELSALFGERNSGEQN